MLHLDGSRPLWKAGGAVPQNTSRPVLYAFTRAFCGFKLFGLGVSLPFSPGLPLLDDRFRAGVGSVYRA